MSTVTGSRLSEDDLKRIIRDIPDFPQKGILFRDITPLLQDPAAWRTCVDALTDWCRERGIEGVAAVEARGYLIGATLAYNLGVPLIPVRKPGKLPYETVAQKYELEYGSNTLEMHKDAVRAGQKVLVVDDLIATGGSARATAQLIERLGGSVAAFAFLIELTFLHGRDTLAGYEVYSLIKY
ncbi:MAG: adenine phosphoribosyltransferase [Candidatus Xenobia bacterium]